MEDNKPIELHELVSHMNKIGINECPSNVSNNDIFTKLIINKNIKEALSMIDNNKDLKCGWHPLKDILD
jgi:hypothetical protein